MPEVRADNRLRSMLALRGGEKHGSPLTTTVAVFAVSYLYRICTVFRRCVQRAQREDLKMPVQMGFVGTATFGHVDDATGVGMGQGGACFGAMSPKDQDEPLTI